ncbi:hypothetical protein M5E88_01520 [Akkermansia muciniphila]|nr:hypothetical protein M5E88_01520 [Akkermansia muciniphila]
MQKSQFLTLANTKKRQFMQAQSWFNRAHVEQSKQAPGQLERKIRQEKSHFYPILFLKVYIMIFIEKSDSKFGGLKKT